MQITPLPFSFCQCHTGRQETDKALFASRRFPAENVHEVFEWQWIEFPPPRIKLTCPFTVFDFSRIQWRHIK